MVDHRTVAASLRLMSKEISTMTKLVESLHGPDIPGGEEEIDRAYATIAPSLVLVSGQAEALVAAIEHGAQ